MLMIALLVLGAAGVTTAVLATPDRQSPRAAGRQASVPPLGTSQDADAEIPTIPVAVPGWREGQPITEETLRAVKAEDIFWTVYKRHAMTAVQELTQEPWIAKAGRPVNPRELVTPHIRTIRVAIDYRSKTFAKADTSRTANGELAAASICVDGQRYFKTETDLKQGRPYNASTQPGKDARDCPPVLHEDAVKQNPNIGLWVNDGILTGGLSGVQADRFIDCLRQRRLVSVNKAAMVQAAGKSYVAIEGEVNRVEDRTISQDTKHGHDLVRDCFDLGTELKQELHPYPFSVGGAQGLKWIYYLDPSTLRPVFSKRETTPVVDLDGSVSPRDAEYNASVSWGQWAYPATMPKFTLDDGVQPLTVAWPPGLPGK